MMARETACQTPGCVYGFWRFNRQISMRVDLPMDLILSDEQAELLEINLHNAVELVLAPYFADRPDTPEEQP